MAYDMIEKEKYDIVLLDIKMPGLNGLELIEKVRYILVNTDIIFIILSGYAEFSFASEAMKYGVKYYLLKPTDENEMVSTLEKVIAEMKVKSTSHDKITVLFNTISNYVHESNLQAANVEMENIFSILNKKYSKCIRLALDYIYENISEDELTLADISTHLYMNPDYIGKLFKKEMKENFNDYLSSTRIKMAQELIAKYSNYKVSEIAERVGFGCNSQYFSQIFKKHTGYTPKEYKNILMKSK